ncbi:accumulation-associated protein-like [Lytechinus variegatus]|uniref:accumulation-associated protein-like n=1 Tax=Lytechinus variegatus TaxID=7654 RepID=UPI001BB1932B|nr:accumulation-associated protein-like [Lytechinus variegatus]
MIPIINAHRLPAPAQRGNQPASPCPIIVRFSRMADRDRLLQAFEQPRRLPGNQHPALPGQSAQPAHPGQLVQPARPGEASQPGQSAQPGQAAQPGRPARPGQPAVPAQPGQPAVPAQPGQPAVPAQPRQPGQHGQSGQPGQPAQQSYVEVASESLPNANQRFNRVTIRTDLPAKMKKERGRLASLAYKLRHEKKLATRIRQIGTKIFLQTRQGTANSSVQPNWVNWTE